MGSHISFSMRLLLAIPVILAVKLCFSLVHTEQKCTDAWYAPAFVDG